MENQYIDFFLKRAYKLKIRKLSWKPQMFPLKHILKFDLAIPSKFSIFP